MMKSCLFVSLFVVVICSSALGAGGDLPGNGTSGDPWLIEDFDDFQAFCDDSAYWDDHTRLDCNLDLDPALDGRQVYTQAPIAGGTIDEGYPFYDTAFAGNFNGNGHIIINLQIEGSIYCGLFGKTDFTAVIENLGVENATINASASSAAALVGMNSGIVMRCYAEAKVISSSSRIGGLVGNNERGYIFSCYSIGEVTGDVAIGGLVGKNNKGRIDDCFSTSKVTGSGCYSGGLVGLSYGSISNCYSTGEVSGNCDAGGLVGQIYGDAINCFWDVEASGMSNSDDGTGLTTQEMQMQSTFTSAGWQLADYDKGLHGWYFPAGSYPLLHWQNPDAIAIPDVTGSTLAETQSLLTTKGVTLGDIVYINSWKIPEDTVAGLSVPKGSFVNSSVPIDIFVSSGSTGNGSEEQPYEVACQTDIEAVNDFPGANYIMTTDVHMDHHTIYQSAPIARDTNDSYSDTYKGVSFTGHFNGNGHIISNLNVHGRCYCGLFGKTDSTAVIENLSLENYNIIGSPNHYDYLSRYVGSLVGHNSGSIKNVSLAGTVIANFAAGGLAGYNSGNIENCNSSGSVAGGDATGGLVGQSTGSIISSNSTSTVKGGDFTGGVVGSNNEGTVTNCFASGTVTGVSWVGGLAGKSYSGVITNCFSTGSVTSGLNTQYSGCTGGLLGLNDYGSVSDCYSTGSVMGNSSVGGLVGYNREADVTNSYSIGTVNGTGDNVGGLVGYNKTGSVMKCYAAVEVTGSGRYTGGLVARNSDDGDIINCYSTGSVITDYGYADTGVGGLVGHNIGSIINSYSACSVSGDKRVGGLVGWNYGSISSSYSTGSVFGNVDAGGLVGSNPEGSVNDSFWDMETSGQTSSAGGMGATTAEMTQQNIYSINGWGGDVWKQDVGNDYPRLSWENMAGQLITDPAVTMQGDGSLENPWQIASKDNLLYVSQGSYFQDKHYILIVDIDLEAAIFNQALIGYDGDNSFLGSFDGNGHVISNFTIETYRYAGFFGYLAEGASVVNLGVENSKIDPNNTMYAFIGSLVGYNEGSIVNCYSTGDITAKYSHGDTGAGGLVGYNRGSVASSYSTGSVRGEKHAGGLVGYNEGSIANCYSTGSVATDHRYSFGRYAGGLVGYNQGSITSCYSTGIVTGRDYLGGLVGNNSGGIIASSYSTSSVSGEDAVGGLVGSNFSGNISNCYSTGSVTADNNVGGLVGYNYKGEVTSCFWDVDTSGMTIGYNQSSSYPATVTNVVGKTTVEMQSEGTFTSAGWDYVLETGNGLLDTWYQLPDDYPKLYWQADAGDMNCDGSVDMSDLALIAGDWLAPTNNSYRSYGDVNFDGVSDLSDFATFSSGL